MHILKKADASASNREVVNETSCKCLSFILHNFSEFLEECTRSYIWGRGPQTSLARSPLPMFLTLLPLI
jgi:hypothetical protein